MNARQFVKINLEKNRLNDIVSGYSEDPAGILRALQMHVYGMVDNIIRWRAIEVLGMLAAEFAEKNDETYRNIIRRFIWQMCEESANVPWASPEVIGIIIANSPRKQFEEFVGPLFFHTGLNEICFAGLFWAICRLTPKYDDLINEGITKIYEDREVYSWLLEDDVYTRAYGSLAFKCYHDKKAVPFLKKIVKDEREVVVYRNDEMISTKVSTLVTETLEQY